MKRRKARSDGRVLFLFLGVSFTLVLLGLVIQRTAGNRVGIGETPPSAIVDPAKVLPAGAMNPAMSALEPSVDPTFVFAYELDGGVKASLVVWDRVQGKYRLSSTLDLAGTTENALLYGPQIGVDSAGWGMPVLEVSASSNGPSGAATALIVRDGPALRPLEMFGPGGERSWAVFENGTVMPYFAEFHLEDVDGNGTKEIVATRGLVSADARGDMHRAGTTAVYRWDQGILSYDERLSWAFSLSDEVFPEPAVTADAF